MLLQGIYMLKMEFNEKFLALRDVKKSLCTELKQKLTTIGSLNKKLRVEENLVFPELLPGEEPERRDHVTDSEIAAYIAQKEASAESDAPKDNVLGGFGGAGDMGQSKPAAKGTKDTLKPDGVPKSKQESAEDVIARIAASYPLTPLEQAQRTVNERRWVRENHVHLRDHRLDAITLLTGLDTGFECRLWKRSCCSAECTK